MRRGGLLNRSIDPLDRHTSQKFKTCKKHRYHKIYPHSTLWWETGEFSGRKWLQKLQICCTGGCRFTRFSLHGFTQDS